MQRRREQIPSFLGVYYLSRATINKIQAAWVVQATETYFLGVLEVIEVQDEGMSRVGVG